MKKLLFVISIAIVLLLTACGAEDHGAYWKVGQTNGAFNSVYLASTWDCSISPEPNSSGYYDFQCVSIEKGTIVKRSVKYFEYGEHYIVR